jgi:BlaI family penicillinase repressor
MQDKKPAISDSEWKIMQLVWDKGEAGAAELIEALLPETQWSHRTVRSLLFRLVEKGALATRNEGNRYVYTPLVNREECIRQESETFLEKVFQGDVQQLLVHFVREKKITAGELRSLKSILDQSEEGSDAHA